MRDLIILVKQGEELPAIDKTINLKSSVSVRDVKFKIKKIDSLKWDEDFNIIINVKGQFV